MLLKDEFCLFSNSYKRKSIVHTENDICGKITHSLKTSCIFESYFKYDRFKISHVFPSIGSHDLIYALICAHFV